MGLVLVSCVRLISVDNSLNEMETSKLAPLRVHEDNQAIRAEVSF